MCAEANHRASLSLAQRLVILPVRAYQLLISPWLGANCRFYPTCSSYCEEAVRTHGAWRGGWLSVRRLLRCHPWGGFGFDPVPEQTRRKDA
ncbi:MAG: membrane protein insertion efficiency factor YidD [Pseudomonadota bacterium]